MNMQFNISSLKMIKIYTDGSSRGNPGPGGYGIVMLYKDMRKEISQGYKLTTNNRMELKAVIIALKSIKNKKIPIELYSDSKYVVESIEKGWIWEWEKKNFKNKLNIDLWKEFIPLYKMFDIKFTNLSDEFMSTPLFLYVKDLLFITILYENYN